jgi:hypothetical protein
MMNPSLPASDTLGDLLKLLGDPEAAKKAVEREKAAREREEKAVAAERRQQEHLAVTEHACAVIIEKTDEAVAERERAADHRQAEREVALAAKEQRATDLLAKAEADSAKAAEIRAQFERRQKAWEAA